MHTLKKRFYLVTIISCFCTLILSASFVYGSDNADKEILVIGSGEIIRENLAEARKLAISDAHIKGIEAYLEKTLGSQGMINNFESIINEIIPGSADVIENFHILAEDDNNKSYKILVSIKVNEKLMQERLRNAGIILFEGVPLRVLFMVSQKIKPDEPAFIWWIDPENNTSLSSSELILHRLFQERGFNPVNRLTSMPENGYNPELFKEVLTNEDAAQWGRLYSADIVLTGKVERNEFNALVADIKVIDVKNGSVIASYTHEQIPVDDPEAANSGMDTLEKILSDGVSEIMPDILKAFKKEEEKISHFDIVLKGLDSLRQVTAFMSFIKEKVSGVIYVLPARITPGILTISVEYSGERKMFIDKIRNSPEVPFAIDIGTDDKGLLTITKM